MYSSERLGDHHRVDAFSCGNAILDRWLRSAALTSDRKDVSRTYVWAGSSDTVWAYFALSPDVLYRDGLPKSLAHGDPDRIPAVLIGKLALHTELQGGGRHLGSQLLVDAVARAVAAVEAAGGRYIVVDAIGDDVLAFYEHHGFRRLPPPADHRLVIRSADARRSLEDR
ncbi:MAG: N-acetyltransferase [Actinomycetota bacterium]|nr:N-acetyltransferase [Actinomycetota bacterium]